MVSVKGFFTLILSLYWGLAEPLNAASWQPVAPVACQTNIGEGNVPRCEYSEDDTRQALNRAMPRGMNRCKELALDAIKCCFSPDSKNCKWENFEELPLRHNSAGIAASFDQQVEDYVSGHNLMRRRQFLCNFMIRESCRAPCTEYRNERLAVTNEVGPQLVSPEEPAPQPWVDEGVERADMVLREVCEKRLGSMVRCMGAQADLYKNAAASTATCRREAASYNAKLNQVICYTTAEGLEQCQYAASEIPGYRDLGELGRPAGAGDHTYGQLQVRREDGSISGNCSATAFGDGSQAITAAHCFNANGGRATLWTQDASGRMQSSGATCVPNSNYNYSAPGSIQHDTVICNLDRRAHVNQTYFVATRDPSIPSGCVPQDYYLRCAPVEFQRLDGTQVETITYPASQQRDGQFRPILSNGRIRYDTDTGYFQSGTMGDPGSSGGGYITTMNGYRVIVTNDSARYYSSQYGAGPVIEWRDVAQMRARLTAQKTNGAGSTFR